jgi:hypothetical protein
MPVPEGTFTAAAESLPAYLLRLDREEAVERAALAVGRAAAAVRRASSELATATSDLAQAVEDLRDR